MPEAEVYAVSSNATESISKRSLEDQATDLLRARIVAGDLPLGERLVETALAQRYELSRGTVRAALRRLVNEGLVRQVPYAGYRVIDFSEHDLWELYTLRATLESLAARLAASAISEDGAIPLRDAFDELVRVSDQGDRMAVNRCDHELHLVIVGLSGNERLMQHYTRVENQFRAYIALSNEAVDPREVSECHRELVESICCGQAERAARLAEANITPLAPAGTASAAGDR